MTPILLSLSGGGVRAMAFHAGVLRHLAENRGLGRVEKISSVSGGSLFVGLLLHLGGMRWPTDTEYLTTRLPELRRILTSTDLAQAAVKQLLRARNFKYLLSRANILALAIEDIWGITETLCDLPTSLSWSINATTAETGKRFRFKGNELRDWVLGTTTAKAFPLCDAMAVSAAFPGLIGPYVLNLNMYEWLPPLYSATGDIRLASERFAKIHLYDGGVYDNLGLEAFFDAARGPKPGMASTIVVSDAGAPLSTSFNFGAFDVFRLKHVADIMSDQVRSLRVRGLVAHALGTTGSAAYIRIGTTVDSQVHQFKICRPPGNWMSEEQVTRASSFPTGLKRLSPEDFDLLEAHGYESSILANEIFSFT